MFTKLVQHWIKLGRWIALLRVSLMAGFLLAVVAAPAPLAHAADCQSWHSVRSGETLFRIGLKYNLTWDKIAKANNLSDGNKIYAGQSLCIPARASQPAPSQPSGVPIITITAVVRDQTVTIAAKNFPSNQKFEVRMGAYGTLGIGGILVGSSNSGNGAFTATYTIPAGLKNSSQIAIRLDGPQGYYSYNWFWNNSTN